MAYIPLQYPLLFPYGEDGYQEDIPFRGTSRSCSRRVRVSMHEFIAYRIQERVNEEWLILLGRRLFQQFVVDYYSMVESQWLSYIRNNQKKIRREFLRVWKKPLIVVTLMLKALAPVLFCRHRLLVVEDTCSIIAKMLWPYARDLATLFYF